MLINLGGLQNPYWPVDGVVDYARTVIGALRKSIPSSEKIVIAGSQTVADRLQKEGVVTYPRAAMEDILARSKIAFMTPGLGNIYDAAAFGIPTIWLPPANDSQGRQLALIENHSMSDAALNWPGVVSGADIDYCGDQPAILSQIAEAAAALTRDNAAQERLSRLAQTQYQALIGKQGSNTTQIIEHFGKGGEREVARLVVEQARTYCHG